ncbi:alpha/beta hydrolase [Nesterenkonia natronophila]|uniref:Alpha/beta hydrolase n=2 Tax=Nesterenkonia natronophila TaxID=2174932 RepID=A0A3A4F108_9MICC|nr:alpha/beta hydrolase [Nesterenkonia natronophila]
MNLFGVHAREYVAKDRLIYGNRHGQILSSTHLRPTLASLDLAHMTIEHERKTPASQSSSADAAESDLEELSEELLTDSPPEEWVADYLPHCSRMTLPLGEDFEGPVSATLVRCDQDPEPGSALPPVLQIHGWTDYFYNLPMAYQWIERGHRFYALDLRKYGRSLREHQTPGHIEDLTEYDAEINAACAVIAAENPELPAPVISAHSTGGLVATLWAERHARGASALVLNSPWLELAGQSPARAAAEGIVTPLNRVNPTAELKVPRPENYWQSMSSQAHGEWELHPRWRPRVSFPMTMGWLKAVFAGHRRVRQGLDLDVPVLVLLAEKSAFRTQWNEQFQESDSVLDVDLLARRSHKLSRVVTIVRIPRAMHDIFASAEQVRNAAFQETSKWLRGYVG